jgi:excinuclease ABC subunit B
LIRIIIVKPIVDILDTDARAADSEGEYDTQIVAKLTPVQLAKELKTLEKQMYQ